MFSCIIFLSQASTGILPTYTYHHRYIFRNQIRALEINRISSMCAGQQNLVQIMQATDRNYGLRDPQLCTNEKNLANSCSRIYLKIMLHMPREGPERVTQVFMLGWSLVCKFALVWSIAGLPSIAYPCRIEPVWTIQTVFQARLFHPFLLHMMYLCRQGSTGR